jgi:Fe-S-cluster containining protein
MNEEVYILTMETRFGHVNIAVPFICQKCGECCRRLSVAGFGKPCIHLNSETNLCTIYDRRPAECRGFPLGCDAGFGKALYIGCPAIKRFLKLEGSLLIGYPHMATLQTKWKKPSFEAYQHFLKKLLKANPTEEELQQFEKLNRIR